jgi:hypothetical protein
MLSLTAEAAPLSVLAQTPLHLSWPCSNLRVALPILISISQVHSHCNSTLPTPHNDSRHHLCHHPIWRSSSLLALTVGSEAHQYYLARISLTWADFTKQLKGYEGVTAQCHNCGNWSAHVIQSWDWFTFCWIPIIPLGGKHRDVSA